MLLLPHIEEGPLYKDYRLDEPWDGPNNRKLVSRMPKMYACPSDRQAREQYRTSYFVIVGPNTLFRTQMDDRFFSPEGLGRFEGFRGPAGLSPSQVKRPGETILFVESSSMSVNWMEPRDIPFESLSFQPGEPNAPSISSVHPLPHIALVDGNRRTIEGLDAETLRKMCLVDLTK